MVNGKMSAATFTGLSQGPSGSTDLACLEASTTEMSLMQTAAKLFEERDRLAHATQEIDNAIRVACRAYGDANRVWGVSPDMLRRELRMKGLA